MLDEYIKELIATNNRVIIPNFGAFLLRATSKNKNKKELSEKIDDIYFSPFLKFNDELLVNHIIKKEGGDQKEAMDKIKDYIRHIEEKVRDEENYKIEGLGEFHMDDQGKIQFKIYSSSEAEEPAKPKRAATQKESTQTKTINEKAAQDKKPARETSSQATGSSRKSESRETTASKAGTHKRTHSRASSGAKTPPPPQSGRKQTKQKSRGGTNRGLVLSIAIGVPVAAIFIWAMLNFDTVQDIFRKDVRQIDLTEEAGDQMPADQNETRDNRETGDQQARDNQANRDRTSGEQTTATRDEPRQESNRRQTAAPAKKYYIVAGSFKNRQNAVNFRQKLLDQGYNSEMIGERNGMHAVSYASFTSKSRAQAELKRMREEDGLTAWLLYY